MHIRFWKTMVNDHQHASILQSTNLFHAYDLWNTYFTEIHRDTDPSQSLYHLISWRADAMSDLTLIIMRHVLFNNVTLWKPWRRQPAPPECTSWCTLKRCLVYVPRQNERTSLLGGFYFQGSRHVWMILNVTLTEGLIQLWDGYTPDNNINEQAVSRSLHLSDSEDSTKVPYCKNCSSHPWG